MIIKGNFWGGTSEEHEKDCTPGPWLVMAKESGEESFEECVFYTLESDLESWKRLQLQVTIQTVRTDGARLHDGSRMPSCILDFGDEAHAMILQTAHKVPLNDWVCILPPCGSDPSNVSVFFDAATRQIVASQYAERFNEYQGSYLCVIRVCEMSQTFTMAAASSSIVARVRTDHHIFCI